MKKDVIKQKIEYITKLLNIEDLLKRNPNQLSGGQCQRVAIGKAIMREPKVFLMDEPLSNLDLLSRNKLREELKTLHKQLKTTIVFVTHDQVEAMTLATKLVVMNKGKIEQVGTPYDIFTNPKTKFVAEFIGSPQMNFFNIKLKENALKFFGKELFLKLHFV